MTRKFLAQARLAAVGAAAGVGMVLLIMTSRVSGWMRALALRWWPASALTLFRPLPGCVAAAQHSHGL